MSNYVMFNNNIAFHPGYYIKEIVEESGLTQEDFAKRLDTTPKNLSLLIRGEQSLSTDIAMKLSRMLGTSVKYWLNLQNAYDVLVAEFEFQEESAKEREIFNCLEYKYFRQNFGLPDLPRKVEQQIEQVRGFLNVSTLGVLKKRDLAVSFRSAADLQETNVIKANVMIQIAVNLALRVEAPKYNKRKFLNAVEYALTLTSSHNNFYSLIKAAFLEAGVVLVVLPNLPGSKINGATKKLGDNIMLMVNDRNLYADSFWFTLFHEIGHIMNGDYGISLEKESGFKEEIADKYAENALIPIEAYTQFVAIGKYDICAIKQFATSIGRDSGIVVGRLLNDGLVEYSNRELLGLRSRYRVITR